MTVYSSPSAYCPFDSLQEQKSGRRPYQCWWCRLKVRGVRMRGLHFMRLSLCHRREKVHFCRPMHCFPEVWLVNLVERQIEVYSEPADEGYQAQAAHTLTAGFAPQRFPEVTGPWLSEVPLELLA